MDLKNLLILAGASAAAFFLSKFALKGDDRVESRRRDAIALGQWAVQNGLPTVSSLLTAYAVGDYSGMLHWISVVRDIVGDQTQAKAALDQFLAVQLDKRLASSDEREALFALIGKKLGGTLVLNKE